MSGGGVRVEYLEWMEEGTGNKMVPEWMAHQLAAMGVSRPSPVQYSVLPHALKGQDVIGCASTGSGKTLCYVIPILLQLALNPSAYHSIVLLPSRELAIQVKEVFMAVSRAASSAQAMQHLRCHVIIGGEPLAEQAAQLRQLKPHVLIATPGRLAQIIRLDAASASPLGLHRVKYLVFDEADRLLAAEFAEDIGTITGAVPAPPHRRTFLFSATMTRNISKLASLGMTDEDSAPFCYDESAASEALGQQDQVSSGQPNSNASSSASGLPTAPTTKQPAWKINSSISQFYCFMPEQMKDCYLVYLIRSFLGLKVSSRLDNDTSSSTSSHSKAGGKRGKGQGKRQGSAAPAVVVNAQNQIIVFVRSCQSCEEIYHMLLELEVPTCRLHSWMKQEDRKAALTKFRSGLAAVLIATDLAHRGLDIQQVRLVVQYNLPRTTVEYVHRVGRTGRTHPNSASSSSSATAAALTSRAISLVDQYDVQMLLNIETDLATKIEEFPVKEASVLSHLNDVIQARELAKLKLDENGFSEKIESKKRQKRERSTSDHLPDIPHSNAPKKKKIA
jgi:ATP-dependent RNA helicase DDX49/DBP8